MMKNISKITLIATLLALALFFVNSEATILQAQASPFLISPYYGTEIVTSDCCTHIGHDYALSYEKVLAAASGTISRARWANDTCHNYTVLAGQPGFNQTTANTCSYGLHIYIDHSGNYQTRYGHLTAMHFPLNTTSIQVSQGDIIGTSGSTGWSSGPHLHFEVRQNGVNVDPDSPSLWLDGQFANPSRPIPAPNQGEIIVIDDNTTNTNGFSKGQGGTFNNPCTGSGCSAWYLQSSGGYSNDRYYAFVSMTADY